jgi:hypothetical protein
MTMHVRATYVTAVRAVGMPRGNAMPAAVGADVREPLVDDGYRHRAIGSLPALGLAILAAVLTTGLMWVAL